MISLDLYLACKSKIDEFEAYYFEKLLDVNNPYLFTPISGECGNTMKHRKENPLDLGYFVCSVKHKRNSIFVDEINELVAQTVLNQIQSIAVSVAKKVISKNIVMTQKKLQKALKSTTSDYIDTSLKICTLDSKKKSTLSKHLLEFQALKDKYSELEQDLLSLQRLSGEIKEISQLLSQFNHDFSEKELQRLVDLFVDKILVYETHLHIDLYFASFTKESNAS